MADKKRMIQGIDGYEVKQAIELAGGEVILAENKTAEARYLVCDCSWDNPFSVELYQNAVGSADFLEMMKEFTRRLSERVAAVETERETRSIPFQTLTAEDCYPKGETDLNGCVVVIKPEKLAPEYRSIDNQLALCTGGFGASPNSRGRAVFCQNLITGKTTQWNRDDIAGTVSAERLPDWARINLDALRKPAEKESVVDKIRQGQQATESNKPAQKKRDKGGPEL